MAKNQIFSLTKNQIFGLTLRVEVEGQLNGTKLLCDSGKNVGRLICHFDGLGLALLRVKEMYAIIETCGKPLFSFFPLQRCATNSE